MAESEARSGTPYFEEGAQIRIGHSVPLPGQITGKRIVLLDVGLDPQADFLPTARTEGERFATLAGITRSSSGVDVDPRRAQNFLRSRMISMGYEPQSVERALSILPDLLSSRPPAPSG